MLDILRKHAASTLIKIILGMIILSFVFFYGWNKMRGRKYSGGVSGEAAATVNGENIPSAEYSFFYDQTEQNFGGNLKSAENKDAIRNMLKSIAINQVVRRQLLLQMAEKAGIEISDRELAKFIKNQFTNPETKQFDSNFYLQRYLPYFKNKYGLDYETIVKQDLTIASFENSLNFLTVPLALSDEKTQKEWTFTVVEFNANISDKIKDKNAAIKSAEKMLKEKRSRKWKKLAENMGGKIREKINLTLANRRSLFIGENEDEAFKTIFMLTPKKPIIAKPIIIGDSAYAVILNSVKEKEVPVQAEPFIQSWLQAMVQKSDIKVYVK